MSISDLRTILLIMGTRLPGGRRAQSPFWHYASKLLRSADGFFKGVPPARMTPRRPSKQQSTPACGLMCFVIWMVQNISTLSRQTGSYRVLCIDKISIFKATEFYSFNSKYGFPINDSTSTSSETFTSNSTLTSELSACWIILITSGYVK